MLQESKHVTKHCDGCGKRLEDRDAFVYTTDFKPTYIEKGDLHICPACAFEIMHEYLVKDIPTTELKEMLKDTRPFSNTSGELFDIGYPENGFTQMHLTPGTGIHKSPSITCAAAPTIGVDSMTLGSCSGADDMSIGIATLHNLNVKA